MANNFSGDLNCVALWKFDNNADDGKGGNDLTVVGSPSYDSGDKKEGTHSIDLELSSTQYCAISDGDLDSGFPGKSGTSEQSFSICCWVKPESIPTQAYIIAKQASGARSFSIDTYSGAVRFLIGYNSGSSFTRITFGTAMSAGKWYHIGVVYDSSDNTMKIRVWDDDAGALLDSNKGGTAGGDMSPDTADLEVGRSTEYQYEWDGLIDEVVFFNKVLSDDDIDAIRAGSYGAAAGEKQSSDGGSGAEASIVSAILTGTESGAGVDTVESLQTPAAKTSADVGSGAEGTPTQSAMLTDSESGSGVDAVESLQTPAAKTSTDVGGGIEALVARLLAGEESGSAVEASSLDTGGGLENLFADESAEGADRLVARIEMPTKGGGMKLWT